MSFIIILKNCTKNKTEKKTLKIISLIAKKTLAFFKQNLQLLLIRPIPVLVVPLKSWPLECFHQPPWQRVSSFPGKIAWLRLFLSLSWPFLVLFA